MLSFLKKTIRYSSVEDDECDNELKLGGASQLHSSKIIIKTGPLSVLFVIILFFSSIISSWILFFNVKHSHRQDIESVISTRPSIFCQQAPTRREWRTLNAADRQDYVRAVRCLTTKLSKLGNNGTLYDDFPWVHKYTSSKTHASAPFLPWHRYYLHLYETALKQECSFHGSLPYWDWSLDWSEFRSAPVWEADSGLGGDGIGFDSVGNGRCVTSGPFSDIEMSFYDGEYQPHCLSRGFPSEKELKELGQLIRPEVIDNLMDEDDYQNFAGGLELRAHKFLSHSVRGDLSRFTGPNDPVFFLHHVNIDRLWWQWQQTRPRDRITAYVGKANNNTEAAARLTDTLDMGGLSKNVQVVDVMDTNGGQFCYGY